MFTSILRTIVPALWGSFITWAIGLLPALEPHREALLEYGTPLSAIIAAVLIAAWYAFWRWLEPKLPDWLTRAVRIGVEPAKDLGVFSNDQAKSWGLPFATT